MAVELSPKERQAYPLLLTGKTIRSISDDLGVPLKTLEHRLHIMYGKLGVSSRYELLARRNDELTGFLKQCAEVLREIDNGNFNQAETIGQVRAVLRRLIKAKIINQKRT